MKNAVPMPDECFSEIEIFNRYIYLHLMASARAPDDNAELVRDTK